MMDDIQALSQLIAAAIQYGKNSSAFICRSPHHTYEDMKKYVNNLEHETFFLWEFLGSQGLADEAREYLADHEDTEIPFVWE